MRKAPFLLVLPLLACLTASAGPGKGPMGAEGRGGLPFVRRALAALDLSDQQKTQVREVLEAQKPAIQALMEKARADRQKLDTLLQTPNPDPAAVGTAFLAVHKNREAMKSERDLALSEVKKVLSPEQAAKLDAILKFARPGRGMREGGPGGHRFGN